MKLLPRSMVCPECESQPRGLRGHAELRETFRVSLPRNDYVLYTCVRCHAIWQRRTMANGYFWQLRIASRPLRETITQQ